MGWVFEKKRVTKLICYFSFQVIGKSYVGDWFLIYLLGQNIDSVIFKDVIHELAKKLGYRSREIGETWLKNGDKPDIMNGHGMNGIH